MADFRYDPRQRPVQPPAPAADAFTIHTAVVAEGVSLAFVREGVGGVPLLLVHGYPETKRIWWRNIEALAAAGFEVIVPDLRGMGDSERTIEQKYYQKIELAQDIIEIINSFEFES